MREVDYELEKELENGNFKRLDLDCWFKSYQYNYIYYAIQGCDKVINKEVLDFIITYAELLMMRPNENTKHKSEDIIFNCEYLLTQAIIVGAKHKTKYHNVIKPLFFSTNEMVRLYCYANLDIDKNDLINEASNRIKKVVRIREEFNYCWDNEVFDIFTKARISYLMKALELKAINYLTYNKDLEYTPTHIFSLLFVEDILIPKFDIDVLYAIQDKRILAYCLNRLIAEDVIRFKSDVRLPEYFDTNRHHSSTNRIRTKRPEAITTFDKIYTVKD